MTIIGPGTENGQGCSPTCLIWQCTALVYNKNYCERVLIYIDAHDDNN